MKRLVLLSKKFSQKNSQQNFIVMTWFLHFFLGQMSVFFNEPIRMRSKNKRMKKGEKDAFALSFTNVKKLRLMGKHSFVLLRR